MFTRTEQAFFFLTILLAVGMVTSWIVFLILLFSEKIRLEKDSIKVFVSIQAVFSVLFGFCARKSIRVIANHFTNHPALI